MIQVMTNAATAQVALAENEIEAMNVVAEFGTMARRPALEFAPHKLQWMTGNNDCREASGKAMARYAGWVVEQPDLEAGATPEDYELYDAMAILCGMTVTDEQGVIILDRFDHSAVAWELAIQHPATDATPKHTTKYWALPLLTLYVVCEGVPSRYEMSRDAKARWGVAYGWDGARNRSRIEFRAYTKEFFEVGYNYAFRVSISGHITDKMLNALKLHNRTLAYADGLRSAVRRDAAPFPFYAFGLPVACSQVAMTVGSKEGKKSDVYYPVASVPRTLSPNFLMATAIRGDWAILLEDGDRVSAVIDWSLERSATITDGETDDEKGSVDSAPF